ncbi:MAG: 2-aminoadipate transaminase [Granulosicoccus sp.]|jgi:2-aminoadipate transaminase
MNSKRPFARWLDDTNEVTRIFLSAGQIPDLINLAGGLPEPSVWPIDELADLAQKAILNHSMEALAYSPIEGLPKLRDVIADRYSNDNTQLTSDNVLVTTGGMQALDLLGKIMLDEGGLIAGQFPTYLGALDAWRPRQPTYRHMQLEGNVDFDAHAALDGAQFAYTVPNFSNPSGFLVPLETRKALVDAAHATGTLLVEDDPYGTLNLDGSPLPRLLDLSAKKQSGVYDGPVVYLGTLSKMLAPGLRIGWIIAAPDVIAALVLAKQGSDMCSSGLCQQIAQQALSQGVIEKILPPTLDIYRTRRNVLCDAMDTHLSDLFQWTKPQGGMFVWAQALDLQMNTNRLLETAMDCGVCVSPSSAFDPSGANTSAIRINFTLNEPDKLIEGIKRLETAARRLL